MMNPFEDNNTENSRDTDRFIQSTMYIPIINRTSLFCYILVGFIYILEFFTIILGSTNNDKTIGLNNSDFTIQYWLMIFSIFNMCSVIIFVNNWIYYIIKI